MNIISTIIPIFIIIFLGWLSRRIGVFSKEFINQSNGLVYHIAIPAMIFSSISKATLKTQMNLAVIFICLISLLFITLIAWSTAVLLKTKKSSTGSFIQASFHCNIGYIGLAVAFYYLGDSGFVKAAIIGGFLMILQNILAVLVLQYHNPDNAGWPGTFDIIKKTMTNPVILSALAGIIFSLLDLKMPLIIDRTLGILKGMGLPLALMIIGASLSFEKLKPRFFNALISSGFKILITPAIGMVLFTIFSISPKDYLPGLILLASPTATVAYIMGNQIGGDSDLAAAAISISTIFSSVTYGFWLSIG
jgi:predicted permease